MDELSVLVEGIRFIENMMTNPVDKEAIAGELDGLRDMFTKSVVARKNLRAGKVLQADDLSLKKPGTGIPASQLPEVIGRRLKRSLKANTLIAESDLE